MKAHLINMHLLVPRSRSSAKVKVKYKDYISQKIAVLGAFMFQYLFSIYIDVRPGTHAAIGMSDLDLKKRAQVCFVSNRDGNK